MGEIDIREGRGAVRGHKNERSSASVCLDLGGAGFQSSGDVVRNRKAVYSSCFGADVSSWSSHTFLLKLEEREPLNANHPLRCSLNSPWGMELADEIFWLEKPLRVCLRVLETETKGLPPKGEKWTGGQVNLFGCPSSNWTSMSGVRIILQRVLVWVAFLLLEGEWPEWKSFKCS